jgi:hypothetical protein
MESADDKAEETGQENPVRSACILRNCKKQQNNEENLIRVSVQHPGLLPLPYWQERA